MKPFLRILVAGVALLVLPVPAAADLFLCFPGPLALGPQQITGESPDVYFKDCIEPDVAAQTAFLEGDLAELRDVRFTKRVDSASIPLRRALIDGTPLTAATFYLRPVGALAAADATLVLKLLGARITSMSMDQGSEVGTEAISLRATRLESAYRKQNPDGSLQPAVLTCWDFAAGTSTPGACP